MGGTSGGLSADLLDGVDPGGTGDDCASSDDDDDDFVVVPGPGVCAGIETGAESGTGTVHAAGAGEPCPAVVVVVWGTTT